MSRWRGEGAQHQWGQKNPGTIYFTDQGGAHSQLSPPLPPRYSLLTTLITYVVPTEIGVLLITPEQNFLSLFSIKYCNSSFRRYLAENIYRYSYTIRGFRDHMKIKGWVEVESKEGGGAVQKTPVKLKYQADF